MKKIIILLIPLMFLSASCNLFSKPSPGGLVKTVNGGVDWQFFNTLKDSKTDLSTANISKLAFDRTNREILYAGAYNGGLFKSEDSAVTWARILSKIFVYDFAVHPLEAKTLYVSGFFADHGKVLRTADGGASWQELYNEQSIGNPVRSLAINPSQPNQILIGTDSGNIIKSSDSGLSWRLIKNYNSRINRILWQSGNVYVLARNGGLYKSTDQGENFSSQTASIFGDTTGTYITGTYLENFNQVFVDQLSPSLIYLTTSKGLYKTTDDGKTWNLLKLPVKENEALARSIAVARNNSNIVYTSVGTTIYKTVDGGSSWQTQNIPTTGYVNYILVDPDLPQIAYAGLFVNQ